MATVATMSFRLTAEDAPAEKRIQLPGVQPDGRILLPTQWTLQPAGKQITVGDFPVNMAIHPSGKWAAVLHAGWGEHGVRILDLATEATVSEVRLEQCFYGLCFSPEGTHVFVSGAESESVHQFRFENGFLSTHKRIAVNNEGGDFIPAGLSCSPDGKRLFVACPWANAVVDVSLDPTAPGDASDGGVPILKLPMKVAKPVEKGFPYLVLPSPDGSVLYVSMWNGSGVAVCDATTWNRKAIWPTESHPTEMTFDKDAARLFVSCANSNQVNVFETATGKPIETVSSALYANAPRGSTPNSIAVSPDGNILCVANADNNNVAVFDISEKGRSRALGHIPVGWYPTSVRFAKDGMKLYTANGKGTSPKSNRHGPNPLARVPRTLVEYIGGLYRGTISIIESPNAADLAKYTRTAYACSPLKDEAAVVRAPRLPGNPIPSKVGDPSPIKYCLYIIKENRTYDQVFGDMPEGNGDSSLCLFGEKVTPNHHALAREFVLLDNFYVESEVSADGHEWSTAAYATDYVEKVWPLTYRPNKGKLAYPSEGGSPEGIGLPVSGYIWDRCKEAGVSYRSYGEFVKQAGPPGTPGVAAVPGLVGHIDPEFRVYDLDYPDVKRTERFVSELKRFEAEGEMPRFQVLRLPNDHTHGQRAGKPTPTAMVAENDLALGLLVEAVSQSKFWKETAIFVVEDDAQNGSDHVDAHRTVALVISPYTKRKYVDSNMYSTSSMLRTMELILGLQPMTQFDAAALPMFASFQETPDVTPYVHRAAQVDIAAVNSPDAWGAVASAALDFSSEDRCDDLVLNEIIWKSVKGADSPMPPPVRASFVYTRPGDNDDDDDDDEHDADRAVDDDDDNDRPGTNTRAKPVDEDDDD